MGSRFGNMKRYFVDTLAMIVFSTVSGAFIEIIIAGLSFKQSMEIRLSALPIILFAGRPYGIYRDWFFKLAGRGSGSGVRAALLDTFTNFSFQISLYMVLLFINGVTLEQALKAGLAITLFLLVSGRPYGIFLTYCRRLFGLSGKNIEGY